MSLRSTGLASICSIYFPLIYYFLAFVVTRERMVVSWPYAITKANSQQTIGKSGRSNVQPFSKRRKASYVTTVDFDRGQPTLFSSSKNQGNVVYTRSGLSEGLPLQKYIVGMKYS